MSPLPASAAGLAALNGGGGSAGFGAAQVITVQDPVTGQFQQQVVGSMPMNVNGSGEGRDLHKYLLFFVCFFAPAPQQLALQRLPYVTGATIMTVTDPITGQPVQQVVQTIIAPNTGETSQILTNPNSNLGIVL